MTILPRAFWCCLIAMGAAVGLCSCGGGGMLPGSIYSNDGRILNFEIEKSKGAGAVRALDPATGETFSGSYVGIRERLDVAASGVAVGGNVVATQSGSGSVQSNVANATAFLKGDKGTMLNCTMKIETGFSPHGLGDCQDNQGRTYRLQF